MGTAHTSTGETRPMMVAMVSAQPTALDFMSQYQLYRGYPLYSASCATKPSHHTHAIGALRPWLGLLQIKGRELEDFRGQPLMSLATASLRQNECDLFGSISSGPEPIQFRRRKVPRLGINSALSISLQHLVNRCCYPLNVMALKAVGPPHADSLTAC